MKIKKIFIPLLIVISGTVILSGCYKQDNVKVKTEKTKFYNLASDYNMPATSINTYFVDGNDTRYVDVSNFMASLKGFYQTSYLRKRFNTFNNTLKISFYGMDQNNTTKEYYAEFDWQNDTITVNNRVFFNIIHQSNTTNYSKYLEERDSELIDQKEIVFKLSDYNYNIYLKNNKVLVPFSVMNTIFCSQDYYNIYYNGDAYYGMFYDITALNSSDYLTFRKNNLNDAEQTDELRLETYNHIRFVMNYYYGLKKYKNIDNIDDELKNYKDDILSKDVDVNKNVYYDYFITHLDELHTRIADYSFYSSYDSIARNDIWDLSKTSPARIQYKEVGELLKPKAEAFYGSISGYTHKIVGNNLYIFVPSFDTATDEVVAQIDGYKYDTFEYVKYALDIASGNSSIQKVILDLSLNGGGNAGAQLRTLGFLSNDPIPYYSFNYLDDSLSKSSIYVDSNKNGSYDDNDAYNYDWYILTSYDTFSAANSFTAMAKSLDAKVVGQKSGGGMCSVLPIVLPDQTTIEISSNMAQLALIGEEIQMIEGGVDPDIIKDYNEFYTEI